MTIEHGPSGEAAPSAQTVPEGSNADERERRFGNLRLSASAPVHGSDVRCDSHWRGPADRLRERTGTVGDGVESPRNPPRRITIRQQRWIGLT